MKESKTQDLIDLDFAKTTKTIWIIVKQKYYVVR